MARILRAITYSPRLPDDAEYVRRARSAQPRARRLAVHSLRTAATLVGVIDSEFGRSDQASYGDIRVPTLIVAGADDPLRLPGYADELASYIIPDVEPLVYPECGHVPRLEHPSMFLEDLISFLDRQLRTDAA